MEEEMSLVDVGTGEIMETKEVRTASAPFQNEFDLSPLLKTAGQVEITDEQKEILYAPVKEEDVEIRPDGLIYLPWMEYVTRLRESFGLQFAFVPQGMPKFHNNFIYWGHWLLIQGHLCGFALGEQQYIPKNKTMSYGDAVEGAKSNAKMRLCKDLGMTLELWKPSFIRNWITKYAEQYKDPKTGKMLWRKKQGDSGKKATPKKEESDPYPKKNEEEPRKQHDNVPMSDAQRKKLFAMAKSKEMNNDEIEDFNKWLKDKFETVEDGGKIRLTKTSARKIFDDFDNLYSQFAEKFLI